MTKKTRRRHTAEFRAAAVARLDEPGETLRRRAGVLGHQIGMAAQPITGALDLHDDGVVEQAVEQRGGDDRITEHLAVFGKAAVGGQDHGAALVAGIDELEEQIAAAVGDRQAADLIE